MILKDIIAISGQPGLFRFLAQGKNSMIVEHLETGKRTTAFSSSRISSLDEITVYTQDEDLPLGKVFDRIYDREEGRESIDSKSDAEALKKYFEELVPEYSKEKVYVSDIKKIIQWYNILQKKGMLVKEEPEKPSEETEPEEKVRKDKAREDKVQEEKDQKEKTREEKVAETKKKKAASAPKAKK
ncbi:MAG: DUF5606 domain-containing protein [Bacteroidales bacterium]|jgi:hypothetical protein